VNGAGTPSGSFNGRISSGSCVQEQLCSRHSDWCVCLGCQLKQKEDIAMNSLTRTVFLRLENSAVALLFALLVCAGCAATFQGGTDVAQGRQALFRGDYPTALSHFQSAEKAGPNYVYGTELREGVLSYLGRAQYLNGQLPAARATLEQAIAQHRSDNLARLYLGLTLARQGDQKAAANDIQSGLKGMNDFLNYIINTFSNSFGSFYDQSGNLRKSIAANQAMLAGGNADWAVLIANCEKLAIDYEQVEDIATNDERLFRQMNRP
jgi:tetratricopeptide (TPR) repeat protein